MRAAVYARFSSNLESDASIEDQVRQCHRRIEQEGWSLTEVYSDAAISGATTLCPGYQKLLEDARKGEFDIIVAEALDRLARDQEYIAAIFKRLNRKRRKVNWPMEPTRFPNRRPNAGTGGAFQGVWNCFPSHLP